jgi:Zn-finger nucleic acid-binding protein
MKRMTDDEWLAAARARYEREGADFDIDPDLGTAEPLAPAQGGSGMRCPYCAEPPFLQVFPRSTLETSGEVYCCPQCYGFWAPPGSIEGGLDVAAGDHPALRASKPPPRCRACFGWLMPDGRCAKCKKPLPSLNCPACGLEMTRSEQHGVRLDQCSKCSGTWFDMGELAHVFGIMPAGSLTERYSQMKAAESAAFAGGLLGIGAIEGDGPLDVGTALLGAVGSILRR